MSDVIHNVPVFSPSGLKAGTAVVTKSHIEIVFANPFVGEEIFDTLLINHADGIVIRPSLIPFQQKE